MMDGVPPHLLTRMTVRMCSPTTPPVWIILLVTAKPNLTTRANLKGKGNINPTKVENVEEIKTTHEMESRASKNAMGQ